MGTADVFHACADPVWRGVPKNFQGYQPASTGIAYAGAYFKSTSLSREYVQAELLQPLEADVCYRVGCRINLSNLSCPVNRAGILLTPNPVASPLGMNPQVNWYGTFFSDTVAWVEVFDYYMAQGGESYITVGNFFGDGDTDYSPGCPPPMFSYYYIDDVYVEEVPVEQTVISLDGPVVACDSFLIDPGNPDVVYTWSTGAVGPTLTVYTTGIYSVTASYGCTEDVAEIEVTIIGDVSVDIGPDSVLLCQGDVFEIELDPDMGIYTWSDGSAGASYSIIDPGSYHVTVENGCHQASDTVQVALLDPPLPVSLGADTLLCVGDEIVFALDPALGDFLWQDNSTAPTLTVSNPGVYSVTVSNLCGEQSDAVEIIGLAPPVVSLGAGFHVLCGDEILDIGLDPAMGTYTWQDGSIGPEYSISAPGVYGVTVTNICGMDNDLLEVSQQDIPEVYLGPDQVVCDGQTYILDVSGSGGSIVWEDGSTSPVRVVSASGNYAVTVTNDCGVAEDEVVFVYAADPGPVDLGPDLHLCPGETAVLRPGGTAANYIWSDMSTADTLVVSASGLYVVRVYNDCGSHTDTIMVTVSQDPPVVDLPASVFLCDGQSAVLDAGITGVAYMWSTGSTDPQIMVNAPGTYAVTVSNACGMSTDTAWVLPGGPPPTVSLGPDISLCAGDTLLISPTSTQVTGWQWQDGSTDPTFHVTAPGQLIATGTNACGMAADTMWISAGPPPPDFSLGPDTAICAGDMLTYVIDLADADILWSDGSTGMSITIPGSTTVFASATNACGQAADTVVVAGLDPVPALSLGPDLSFCPGETITFSPGIPDVSYLWHDGSTASTFVAADPGVVSLTITGPCGATSDTVVLTVTTDGPQLDLGPDIEACEGESVRIEAGIAGVQYMWQDGSSLNVLETTTSGVYSLTVTNACGMDSDTVAVWFEGWPPAQDLGPDTLLCEGEALTLFAANGPGVLSVWQDGSAADTFRVDAPGLYSIRASNRCGWTADTVAVAFGQPPDPFVLGPDTVLCPGQSLRLMVPVTGFDIRWQDGSGQPEFLADRTGYYELTLTNACGAASAGLTLTYDTLQPRVILDSATAWCPGQVFTLDATQPFPAAYRWNTGAATPVIEVVSPGFFEVEVTTYCADATDAAVVTASDDCFPEPSFFIPNVFSPNGDNVNDVFAVVPSPDAEIIGMEGSIFDRWGDLVYGSSGLTFQWDGRMAGTPMNPAVYVYIIQITYRRGPDVVIARLAGDVTLMR